MHEVPTIGTLMKDLARVRAGTRYELAEAVWLRWSVRARGYLGWLASQSWLRFCLPVLVRRMSEILECLDHFRADYNTIRPAPGATGRTI